MLQMPPQIAYEYLKQEVANTINRGISELQIPLYQIAQILKDLYTEANAQAQLEYQQAVQQYNAAQQAEAKQKEQE